MRKNKISIVIIGLGNFEDDTGALDRCKYKDSCRGAFAVACDIYHGYFM